MPTAHSITRWGDREPEADAWDAVSFAVDNQALPDSLSALLSAFRRSVSGAVAATFRVRGLTPTLRRWLEENHGDQLPYAERLLRSTALAELLPEVACLQLPGTDGELDSLEFEWLHPLYLAPSIALQLSSESAYDSRPSTVMAKTVVDAYVDQLIGERFDDFHVADTNDCWSNWFYEVWPSWEHTWMITDLQRERATLLCVTDTD